MGLFRKSQWLSMGILASAIIFQFSCKRLPQQTVTPEYNAAAEQTSAKILPPEGLTPAGFYLEDDAGGEATTVSGITSEWPGSSGTWAENKNGQYQRRVEDHWETAVKNPFDNPNTAIVSWNGTTSGQNVNWGADKAYMTNGKDESQFISRDVSGMYADGKWNGWGNMQTDLRKQYSTVTANGFNGQIPQGYNYVNKLNGGMYGRYENGVRVQSGADPTTGFFPTNNRFGTQKVGATVPGQQGKVFPFFQRTENGAFQSPYAVTTGQNGHYTPVNYQGTNHINMNTGIPQQATSVLDILRFGLPQTFMPNQFNPNQLQ